MATINNNDSPNAEGNEVKVWIYSHYRNGSLVPGHYRRLKRGALASSLERDALQYRIALEQGEADLKLLEKVSELERRSRKYKQFDPTETWATRWIACPIAYLFPAERREEWLGDLYELNWEMLHKDYPRWFVSFINIARTVILVLSAIQMKLSDIISLGIKRS